MWKFGLFSNRPLSNLRRPQDAYMGDISSGEAMGKLLRPRSLGVLDSIPIRQAQREEHWYLPLIGPIGFTKCAYKVAFFEMRADENPDGPHNI